MSKAAFILVKSIGLTCIGSTYVRKITIEMIIAFQKKDANIYVRRNGQIFKRYSYVIISNI